jgi:hypothetical protein
LAAANLHTFAFMTTRIFTLLFLVPMFFFAQREKKGNIFTSAADAAKIALAKQKLYAGENISALNLFREVEINNPGDASVKFYVGSCFYNLRQYDKAKESLLKAVEIGKDVKPETHLLLGKIYQMEENFDKAIAEYALFKESKTDDPELNDDADALTSQCNNAKTYMASPLQVGVQNMGPGINSKYDDKNPCITADGRMMIFTTRRPETTSDPVDVEGDGKYFENIYLSRMDSASGEFRSASNGGSSINSKAHDACTGISPDGKQIFIYKNDVNDKDSRGGNVFVSRLAAGHWKTPEPVGKPLNSSYWEGGACVSPDGKRYFFTSERPGGYGSSDIWMVEKMKKNEWGKPVNLGPQINTPFDEAGMFLAPDGKTLFFCSNGPRSMGSYDVFRSIYENGKWSEPQNLGYPINSGAREGQLTISADARYAYLSSDRKGGLGENDLYRIDLKDYAILEKDGKRKTGNGLSILRGVIREGYEGYGMAETDVQVSDQSNNLVAETSTNENGEYFMTLKAGAYNIHVKKKGYADISDNVEIKAGEKETLVFEKGYLMKKGG